MQLLGSGIGFYNSGNFGFGDTTPDAIVEVVGTTEQLRLTHTDGSVDSRFTVDSSGNLTVDNTGTKTIIADDLQLSTNNILDSGSTTRLSVGATNAFTGSLTVSVNADIAGTLKAGNADAFSVNADGDVTAVMSQLDGSSTANGSSGIGSSTSLTLNSAANFDVGNYVRVTSNNCGGTGVNPCYAKITAKAGNTLTITPALTWANGSAVAEFHIPEIGGVDTSQTLANRYGRGYFISGVATGNGTTYYNENSIETSLTSFDLLGNTTNNPNLTSILIGNSSTTTTVAGTVTFTGNVNAPASGTSGYLQRSGTTLSPTNAGDAFTTSGNISTSGSGTITAAGGLTVSGGGASITGNSSIAGTLSGLTGVTFSSGSLNLASGGITNTGSLASVTSITSSGGAISFNNNSNFNVDINIGTSTGTITLGGGSAPLAINSTNFDVTSAGALSGITTIGLSGAISGATATNTINGLVINAGALSSVASITGSGGLTIASGGSGDLTLDSASNVLVFSDATLRRTAAGTTTFDLVDGGTTVMAFTNSGAGVLNLSVDGTFLGNGNSGSTIAACTAGQYIGNGVRVDDGLITAGSCRNDGVSDQRLKANVMSLDSSALDKIKQVNTVTFDFKCDEPQYANSGMDCSYGPHHTGVIAQELAQVLPELVFEDENGYFNVRYQELSIYTLKAVQQLAGQIDGQTAGSTDVHEVKTNGVLRLDQNGVLQNISGLQMTGGGAVLAGGLNNTGGGIINTGAISGVTTIDAQTIRLAANGTDDLLKLTKDGNGVFTVFNNGSVLMKFDATNAFSVQDINGTGIFNIDSLTGRVSIGSGSSSKTVLFVLDNRSLPDDPPGTNGASYYNTVLQRFRCYQDGKWLDCLPAGDLNDPIALDKTTWLQPNAEQEFPGTPRILPNLERAHEFRMRLRVTSPGATGATCRLQYADKDDGPWQDLFANGSGELSISAAGTLKTDWLKLANGAQHQDVIIRTVCKGGDGSRTVVFYGLSMQLR